MSSVAAHPASRIARIELRLAGARAPETRPIELLWSEPEGVWRTVHPCVAVRSIDLASGTVHHRAFRLPPRDPARPEAGPAAPVPLRTLARGAALFETTVPEVHPTRRYAVFGWADAWPRTGDPSHDDRDLPVASVREPAYDPFERALRTPHPELALAIAGGADPLGDAHAALAGDRERQVAEMGGLRRRFSYAIPSEPALAALLGLGPLLEIGAGTGYWAALLRARGADIVALDAHPPGRERNEFHPDARTWTSVDRGGPERASVADRSLLLIWPPYDQPMAAACLERFGGERVAYIGEGDGGATGDARFHRLLGRDWEQIRVVRIPTWPLIADDLRIYRRR